MTDQFPNCVEEEGLTEFQSLGAVVARTLEVMDAAPETGGFADVPQPAKARGTERRGRKAGKKRKKKGGWRALRGMTIQDVDLALRIYWEAARKGMRPNYLVTVNPEAEQGEGYRERKKRLARITDWIRDHLRRRRGQPDIALVIWQWPIGGRLHCHMLIYVAPENDDYMVRWDQRPACHVEEAYDVGALRYCLRERLPGPKGWETSRKLPMISGTRFAGQRLSPSPEAKSLVFLRAKKPRAEVVPEPTREPIIWASDPRGQLLLFGEPPVLTSIENYRGGKLPPPVAEQLEARRRQLGLTQEELAWRAGISRPQISNVIAGRFGLSRDAAERLQAVLKEAA